MPARPRRRHVAGAAALLAATAWLPRTGVAADAIEFEARRISIAGVQLEQVRLRLDLPPDAATGPLRTTVTAQRLDLGADLGRYESLRLACPQTLLDEPEFRCAAASLTARAAPGTPLPPLALQSLLGWNLETGALRARGRWRLRDDLAVDFNLAQGAAGWRAVAGIERGSIDALRAWFDSWRVAAPGAPDGAASLLPAGFSADGRLALRADLRGGERVESGLLTLGVTDLDFGNEDGTVVGEKVAVELRARIVPQGRTRRVEIGLDGTRGQALFGPALLDFGQHPLGATARGSWGADLLELPDIALSQRGLSDVRGAATVVLAPRPQLRSADLELRELRLPEAYTAFAQIALAATDFGALDTRGRITGSARIRDGALVGADARLLGLEIEDTRGKFSMTNLRGQLHWAAAGTAVEPSVLTWTAGSAYGLSGNGARIAFTARGASVALAEPARLPIFDGALIVRALAVDALGSENPVLQFEADIEPISLEKLAPAFGWPALAGKLSGRIPRIDFRDRTLTVAGDVEARVFGGRIVGSNLRLQDPLGPWPRMFADVRAYDLNLAEVTQTFSIGSITGRLEGQLLGLELFNWSPVAFDASFQTPARDRGPHRISARAVGNLSNIGGGGGGVVQALQSGAFRMFDEYDYERIGLRCRLANEVCLMSGIEPTGSGYFILKGKGLPHIDIVGNAGRVSWPQLIGQITTQMRGEGQLRIE